MATKKTKPEEKTVPVEKVQEIAEQAAQQPAQNQVQVNVDFLRTTRVHIAMPCYGGMLTESTFMSFIKWANTARQLGIDWTLETMVNESLISRARNTLTAKFLEQKESTHLFFVDADIGCGGCAQGVGLRRCPHRRWRLGGKGRVVSLMS